MEPTRGIKNIDPIFQRENPMLITKQNSHKITTTQWSNQPKSDDRLPIASHQYASKCIIDNDQISSTNTSNWKQKRRSHRPKHSDSTTYKTQAAKKMTTTRNSNHSRKRRTTTSNQTRTTKHSSTIATYYHNRTHEHTSIYIPYNPTKCHICVGWKASSSVSRRGSVWAVP